MERDRVRSLEANSPIAGPPWLRMHTRTGTSVGGAGIAAWAVCVSCSPAGIWAVKSYPAPFRSTDSGGVTPSATATRKRISSPWRSATACAKHTGCPLVSGTVSVFSSEAGDGISAGMSRWAATNGRTTKSAPSTKTTTAPRIAALRIEPLHDEPEGRQLQEEQRRDDPTRGQRPQPARQRSHRARDRDAVQRNEHQQVAAGDDRIRGVDQQRAKRGGVQTDDRQHRGHAEHEQHVPAAAHRLAVAPRGDDEQDESGPDRHADRVQQITREADLELHERAEQPPQVDVV